MKRHPLPLLALPLLPLPLLPLPLLRLPLLRLPLLRLPLLRLALPWAFQALALTLSLLAAPAQAQNDPAPAPEAGFAMAAPVVGDLDLGPLKGVRKVAVASFVLQAVVAQTTTGGSTSIDFEPALTQDPQRLRRLTEALYSRFQQQVKAAGFELVPHETVVATPEHQALVARGGANPLTLETGSPGSKSGAYKSVFLAPAGLFINVKDDYENLKKNYTSLFTEPDDTLTFTGRISLYANPYPALDAALQKALGAATLHVRVFVPVAYLWSNTSKLGGWTHYSSGGMAAVRLGARFTRIAIGHQGDIAKVYLTEDLLTRGLTQAKLVKETTNLFGKVTGREVNYGLDAPAYEQHLPEMAGAAWDAMLGRLKAAAF